MSARELFLVTAAALCAAAPCTAQEPAFDVASVKVSEFNDGAGRMTPSPDGLTIRNMSLGFCITWAFHLKQYEVVGPDWLQQKAGTRKYDIDAKAGSAVPLDAMRPMLRRLLEERFHLVTHREKRDIDVYALTVAKNGPKHLDPSSDDRCGMDFAGHPGQGQRVTLKGCTMENLAGFLPAWGLEGPVVDMTGLTARYDFILDVPPDDPNIQNSADQSLLVVFPAVEQQFGIRVVRRKAPVEVLVVDRVDQTPTAN